MFTVAGHFDNVLTVFRHGACIIEFLESYSPWNKKQSIIDALYITHLDSRVMEIRILIFVILFESTK